MTGKIVCIANRKGGVGKTTVAVLLAQTLQDQKGRSVAVVDVDPQGSATLALGGPPQRHGDGAADESRSELVVGVDLNEEFEELYLEETLTKRSGFSARVKIGDFAWSQVSALTRRPDVPLALVPCSEELWGFEDKIADSADFLGQKKKSLSRLFRSLLRRLARDFDFVVIDTPPGRSFLGREAVTRADLILVPCDVTSLAYGALRVFVDELKRLRKLERAYLVWTKYSDLESVRVFEDELDDDMLERKLFDGTFDENFQGVKMSRSFAKGVVQTHARSFESAYPRQSRQIADALARAVLKRLNME